MDLAIKVSESLLDLGTFVIRMNSPYCSFYYAPNILALDMGQEILKLTGFYHLIYSATRISIDCEYTAKSMLVKDQAKRRYTITYDPEPSPALHCKCCTVKEQRRTADKNLIPEHKSIIITPIPTKVASNIRVRSRLRDSSAVYHKKTTSMA